MKVELTMKRLLTALALCSSVAAAGHAQKPQTDREADGLRGPVKTVEVESVMLRKQDGRYKEDPRSSASTRKTTYSADGELLLEEQLASVRQMRKVMGKVVYGYADGVRVAEHYVPRMMSIGVTIGDVPSPSPSPSPPRAGPDIVERLKYKYDDKGRRVEEITERVYEGRVNGGMRTVYRLEDRRRETLLYLGDTLDMRTVETLDERGNPVESVSYKAGSDEVRWKSSYTAYEFDARGNWVKRVKSEWITRDGQSRYEPSEAEYRTITYF